MKLANEGESSRQVASFGAPVLGSFLSALNQFIADHATPPIIPSLNIMFTTSARSRQNVIRDQTVEWIEKYFPGLFREIHFGNHFSLHGASRSKSDICRCLGAQVLIDDNPRYALECAEIGMKVLLFDYQSSYPWSRTGSATAHPMVTEVHDWREVEDKLQAWMLA
ncbi:hypothetical protein ZIOFF_017223 [Zingiber officinale]|uniref:Uncharacterized protein n=1 Tax=Zingiber officinale TaxID=94328 RepID=A0A8J5LNW4_ZINOF|nr:hypothetical protein ZIOFF_017223 [Zingiber officinale]